MNVIEAITGRASTRAFLDKPVPRETISQVLDAARWAPSGVNTQPWQVAVVSGARKYQIGEAIVAARLMGVEPNPDYAYYADELPAEMLERKRACGFALYGALGIERQDKERRQEQWLKNYHGFGAPVELFVMIDAKLQAGSFLDTGMFVQNIMLAAREYDLETCPQAAMAEYPDIVRDVLELPSSLCLVCGIAIGYPDRSDPVNCYRTERESVDGFTKWYE